jgi:hypothetical protein
VTGNNTIIGTWTSTLQNKTTVDPFNIELSSTSIVQSSSINDVVGTLSSSGGVAPFTYELIDNGAGNFKLENGNEVQVASALDVQDSPVLISVKVTDSIGNSYIKNFNIIIEAFENNNSLNFNGVNQDLNGGNVHNYDIATAFSISMWIKPQNISGTRILFSKAGDAPNVYGYMLRHNATTGDLLVQLRSPGGSRSHTFDVSLTAGVWQMVTFTYSGNGNISGASAYVNETKNTTSPSGSLSGSWLVGQDFEIGSRNGTLFFSGNIDEVTVWNKELSASEVSEIYNSGIPDNPEEYSMSNSLVSYYTMGDGDTLPTISDNVGSNDLTAVNMSSSNIQSDVPA